MAVSPFPRDAEKELGILEAMGPTEPETAEDWLDVDGVRTACGASSEEGAEMCADMRACAFSFRRGAAILH